VRPNVACFTRARAGRLRRLELGDLALRGRLRMVVRVRRSMRVRDRVLL
jgi:hypothetical protein